MPEVRQFENSAVYRGWTALEMARVDAGVATFVGVQSGLAMGVGARRRLPGAAGALAAADGHAARWSAPSG